MKTPVPSNSKMDEYIVEMPCRGTLYYTVPAKSKAEALRKVNTRTDDVEDFDNQITVSGKARKARIIA